MTDNQLIRLIERRIKTAYKSNGISNVKLAISYMAIDKIAVGACIFANTIRFYPFVFVNASSNCFSAFKLNLPVQLHAYIKNWFLRRKANMLCLDDVGMPHDVMHLIAYGIIEGLKDQHIAMRLIGPSPIEVFRSTESYEEISIEADLMVV